jgi:hypothetical protein
MFQDQVHPDLYDFRALDKQEWFVDEIIGHQWKEAKKLEFHMQWTQGDTTWEPLDHCKDLDALNHYLELQGVLHPAQLPKKRDNRSTGG